MVDSAAYANGFQDGVNKMVGSPMGEFVREYYKAREKYGPMASAHEGFAVINEEFDEVWEIVKQKQTERDYAALRKEIIQVGAMALAFLIEVVDVQQNRRTHDASLGKD